MSERAAKKTLEYYDQNSAGFTSDTIDVKFTGIQDRFLSFLEGGARILDFGCGSGRDSKYFLSKGYKVDACDGSAEMVKIAAATAGIPVKQMLFSDLSDVAKYDGIFACASILHVPSEELPDIFRRMRRAVKKGGVIYVSFKYGNFEGERKGRYFTDLDEEGLKKILIAAASEAPAAQGEPTVTQDVSAASQGESAAAQGEPAATQGVPAASQGESAAAQDDPTPLQITDLWVTGDARPGRNSEKWLNVILRK